MARGKHAAALFEVIHSSKGSAHTTDSLRTPKWWFKTRPQHDPQPIHAAPPAAAAQGRSTASVASRSATAVASRPAAVAPRLAAVEAIAPHPHPQPVAPRVDPRLRNDPTLGRLERTASGVVRHVGVVTEDDDDNRSKSKLRLRYPTAVLAVFGVMVTIGVAYVLGKRAADGPDRASGSEIVVDDEAPVVQPEPTHKRSVQPSALDVGRKAKIAGSTPSGAASGAGTQRLADRGTADRTLAARDRDLRPEPHNAPIANSVHGIEPIPPAAAAAVPGPRVAGRNYIIVQSYPEEKMAFEARDVLAKNGIACTVEKGPAYFTHENWFSVVSTKGFDHIHTPECEGAVSAIERVNAKLALGKFKRLEPRLCKWR